MVNDLLNAAKALIFRITHRKNVPWILDNGLHCRSSDCRDPNFVNIGNLELIEKRQHRVVDIPPGGTLSDYIPFYFTPFSPMLLNIKTGWGDIQKRQNEEIAILVSSLHKLKEGRVPFVFSDRHAYLETAQFSSDLSELDRIDWPLLRRRDFKSDPDDIDKKERYQAEALIYKHMSVSSLIGVVCYDEATKSEISEHLRKRSIQLQVVRQPSWYF